jgi:type VI secretion system ImpM family protein
LQDTKIISNTNVSTGFFGKLPGFNDFIKYNAAGKEILSIDNWLQEGLALAKLKYKNDWKNFYNNSLTLNFVYPFTGTENTTLGVISPSNDKSGRSFPFIMFSNINKNVNDSLSFHLIPSAHREIFDLLNDVVDVNKSVEDTSGLKTIIDNLKLSNENDVLIANNYKKFISETKLCDVFIAGDDNHFNLNDFFENNLKIFEHFMCFSFTADLNLTHNSFIISFYIQLLQKIFKYSDSTPGIFWTQLDDKSRLLFLIFTKPSPKDFIDLLLYNGTSPNTVLENTNEDKKEFHSGDSLFRNNSVISGNISLLEFLSSIRNYIN